MTQYQKWFKKLQLQYSMNGIEILLNGHKPKSINVKDLLNLTDNAHDFFTESRLVKFVERAQEN